jgi:AAA15 family ATPase/GTPase
MLPAAIIYGPKGSGKSNILNSLSFIRWFVINSHKAGEPNEPIHLAQFAFESEYRDRSSAFEIDFIIGESVYYYSFELTPAGVMMEALYSSQDGRRRMLYERDRQTFVFGRNLKGPNKTIESITRKNSLFFVSSGSKQSSKTGRYFDFL